MPRTWPKVAKVYWDPYDDVPVIQPRQDEIDLYYVLRLTEPGDARPARPGDYQRLRDSIVRGFGSDKLFRELFENRVVLFNKVPHWDLMYEVASSGNVWGQLYFDPFADTWKFRLSYHGAYEALDKGLVDHVKVDSKYFYNGMAISPSSSSQQSLVVLDYKGRIRAIAENVGDKFVITKTFHDYRPPVETSRRPSTLQDVIKKNKEGLLTLEGRAIRHLIKVHEKYNYKPVVSYSGGKDSLVSLHLAVKAFGGVDMLFNDTGIELPETLKNVEEVSKAYSLDLVTASAGNFFWTAVEAFGPPGKDYRWCCKIIKLVPIAKTSRAKWPSGALNIVGQRAYESLDRAKSPVVWRNKWIPHVVSTTPIQDWSQLSVWLYIYANKLPYNRLYDTGFDRLGCYLCPSSYLAEFKDVSTHYPCLWERWLNVLERWREKLNQPPEWVKYGLWRWLTPAAAKKRVARKIPGYVLDWRKEYTLRLLNSEARLAPLHVKKDANSLEVTFNDDVVEDEAQQTFAENIRMLSFKVWREGDSILVEAKNTRIKIARNTLRVEPFDKDENVEDLADVLKVVYRTRSCAKCASCVLWCPLNRVKMTPKGPLPLVPCPSCKLCIDTCPLADQLVEKVVIPLILGNPKAFKRSSRRHGTDIIQVFTKMYRLRGDRVSPAL
ncbi:phosphoadenosine phosphosulfate reductase [Thermogladius calderae 1633]|uniref:Phosphoadenosine phosphosulfate reductase n=1 Tax=Thermogladius calderae (strain DSM 22663 / VKM B-2946 / 1633) TaxID=1184251 RepID=I3TDA4_THEC1|nr:phosphoadenosine phosphosulfate reductase family protein [Thermogladius calderae]AFK50742.1 phosphoadenosine phosphosulfate reductase [Thermogladius calderae 1633]